MRHRVLLLCAIVVGCGTSSSSSGAPADASTDVPTNDASVESSIDVLDASPPLATVVVDPNAVVGPVPTNFLGISVEWTFLLPYLGDGAGGARSLAVTLLKAFEDEGHRVDVRIGGNSEDDAWWSPTGATPPPGVSYDIGAQDLSTLAALHTATGAHFILGLDLALDDPTNQKSFVEASLAAIPHDAIDAFEIGNEPDLYAKNGSRPSTYGFDAYRADLETYLAALDGIDGARFAAPAVAGSSWLLDLPTLWSADGAHLALGTIHHYAATVCNKKPGDATYPKPSDLLLPHATDPSPVYGPPLAAAHSAGIPLRMAETNSVSCGGADGVSNVFASALWGADWLFGLASLGYVGANFHTPGAYAVFDDFGASLDVRPLYYAMRFFSRATVGASTLVRATTTTSAMVHVYATRGEDGAIRVALLDEDLSASGVVHVVVPGAHGSASLERLTAPALESKTGLSIGGVTWDGSKDGKPIGTATTETVPLSGDGFDVSLPAISAAILTIHP